VGVSGGDWLCRGVGDLGGASLPGVRGPRPRRLGALAGRAKMKGGASHVELDQEFAIHAVLRNGKVTVARTFLAWEEALEAAALSE
jgi:hypothetical protein